jgi:hypothetical protein
MEAVESRRIPKKDECKNVSPEPSLIQANQLSKKVNFGKYCTLYTVNDAPMHMINSHNANQCCSKEHYEKKHTSGKHVKKDSGSRGYIQFNNMIKKEQKRIMVMHDEHLSSEQKQRRNNQILDGGSSHHKKKKSHSHASASSS